MKYCLQCVQPDTRPGIQLNAEGICTACIGHREKLSVINWDERAKNLEQIFDAHRQKTGTNYDCIVPVSGGKDSTYQTYMVKEVYKMRPLCVTYRTPLRTELGQRNLDNLVSRMGVDLLEITVNPETEKKFVLKALKEVGDCGLPQHLGIFAFTLQTAVRLKIPLIVWGENSSLEYGGDAAQRRNPYLTREWAAKNGCLQGRMAEQWADDSLTVKDLRPFQFPSDEEFSEAKVQSIFLGHYLKWDPVENARVAKTLGFQCRPEGPVMGIYDFADLDCKLIVAHHYPKWLKFGMTRTFDNVSVEIRNGRMTRAEGIAWIKKNKDDAPPSDHLRDLCAFLKITEREFHQILEPFRNLSVWKKDAEGNWYIPNFITEQSA